MEGLLEIDGTTWQTPLTGHPRQTVGDARLMPTSYGMNYYPMEGTGGREMYRVVNSRLPVMSLQRREIRKWRTWMVDDPLHWYAMGERVSDLPPGSVLCAGLGLGLMLHHLAKRDDITSVTVVELDPDVIKLITPTIPEKYRGSIVQGDYYEYTRTHAGTPPDSILWDLAVGNPDETRADFILAKALTAFYMPGTPLYCFGERRKRVKETDQMSRALLAVAGNFGL